MGDIVATSDFICAPEDGYMIHQLENTVIVPTIHRLTDGHVAPLNGDDKCMTAARQLACHLSLQTCDGTSCNNINFSPLLHYCTLQSVFKNASYALIVSGADLAGEGDYANRLRVCKSVCESYRKACNAIVDCEDELMFASGSMDSGECSGDGLETHRLQHHLNQIILIILVIVILSSFHTLFVQLRR